MRLTKLAAMLMAAAFACLLSACATIPLGPTIGEAPSAAQVVERLEARRMSVRAFGMRGEIVGKSARGEISGESRIFGRFPDRLRAEIMGPFDKPVLLMASDGVRLTVLAYSEGKAYVGPATRANLARFLGLALTPAEAYTLLTGSVPLPEADTGQIRGQVQLSSAPGLALLRLNRRAGVDEGLIFGLGDYAVREAWLRQGGGGIGLNCRFDAFENPPQGRFPRRIELTDSDGRSLTLNNDKLVINQDLDDRIFEIDIPPGLEVQNLD